MTVPRAPFEAERAVITGFGKLCTTTRAPVFGVGFASAFETSRIEYADVENVDTGETVVPDHCVCKVV